MKEQVAERIKAFRLHIGLSVSEIAEILGKGTPAIYAIEQGRVFPQLDDLATMQEHYGLNLNWIISGKGNLVLPRGDEEHSPDSLLGLIAALRKDPDNDELAEKVEHQLSIMTERLDKLNKVYEVLQDSK